MSATVVVTSVLPVTARSVLAVAGAACIAATTWELRDMFAVPGTVGLTALVLAAAWMAGGGFVLAAVLADRHRWSLQGDHLEFEWNSLLGVQRQSHRLADIDRVELVELTRSGDRKTWSVEVRLRSGTVFMLPPSEDRGRMAQAASTVLEAMMDTCARR
jgi:hypothetical protein